MNGVGYQGFEALRRNAGLGYVIIPPGLDRAAYVDECYRTGRVTMIQESGEMTCDVMVDATSLPLLEFPPATGKLGTSVVWVNIPGYEMPVVVAVLHANDHMGSTGEGQWHQTATRPGRKASLTLNAKVPAVSAEAQGAGAQVNVSALSPENDARLNAFVQGDTSVWSTGEVRVEAAKSASMGVVDPEGEGDKARLTLTPEEATLVAPKIRFGEGQQPLLLGTDTVDTLAALCDALANLKVPTANGPSGIPLNTPEFLKIKAGLEKLKSALSFTD